MNKNFFSKLYEVRGKEVLIITKPMTQEEARKIFLYRPYLPGCESRFGGNRYIYDAYLLINKQAKRCIMCSAPTRNEYLKNGICPDCDGRSERNGKDPRKR